jgi:chitin synthase
LLLTAINPHFSNGHGWQPECSCHIFCDLVDLASSSGSTTIYFFNDVILAIFQAHFHADLPYTRTGSTNLLIINPYRTLANVDDLSAKVYEKCSYKDTSLLVLNSPRPFQLHLYDVAAQVYLLMHCRNKFQAHPSFFASTDVVGWG